MNYLTGQTLLLTAFILFFLGLLVFAIKKNWLVKLMGIEMMLNSINLLFIYFNYLYGGQDGQIIALFIMIVAACEVAVAISIMVNIYRFKRSLNTDQLSN